MTTTHNSPDHCQCHPSDCTGASPPEPTMLMWGSPSDTTWRPRSIPLTGWWHSGPVPVGCVSSSAYVLSLVGVFSVGVGLRVWGIQRLCTIFPEFLFVQVTLGGSLQCGTERCCKRSINVWTNHCSMQMRKWCPRAMWLEQEPTGAVHQAGTSEFWLTVSPCHDLLRSRDYKWVTFLGNKLPNSQGPASTSCSNQPSPSLLFRDLMTSP